MERVNYTLYCKKCDCTWHVAGLIERGGCNDYETVVCPRCQGSYFMMHLSQWT
jgi:hypothetical protein